MPPQEGSPEALFSEAVDAHQAGRLDEAEGMYRRLLDIAPGHPEVLNLLGVVQAQRGNGEAAISLITQALEAAPDHAGARYNLGTALLDAGRPAEAADAFRSVLELDPGNGGAAFNLGMALAALGRHADAVEAFRRTVAADPENAAALAECAASLEKTGNPGEAVALLEKAVVAAPHDADKWFDLGRTRLVCRGWNDAVAAFDRALDLNPWHVRSIAFKGTALHEAGQDAEAEALIDLERFIRVGPLVPDGTEPFSVAALREAVAAHPTLVWEPSQTTTTGGAQTGNLVDDTDPAIAAFVTVLKARVEEFVASVSVDPGHPFTRRVPSRWRYSIWGTVLDRDGHQKPHLHPGGWLSGVYYADVPEDALHDEDGTHAGWIEFGAPGYGIEPVRPARVRYIRPEPGTLVLFPSCFFHRTVPLEAPGRRISIAFDLIPTEWASA